MVDDFKTTESIMQETATALREPRGLRDAVAREKSAIDGEILISNELSEAIHMAIGQLEDKVSPIRADQPPSDRERAMRPMAGSSTVYQRIYETNEVFLRALERINRLTRELEV